QLDTVLLAMAMAALGLTTHVSALRQAGLKPLLLSLILFAWLLFGGLAIHQGALAVLG
uniref:putative sulfate exporter family transporter n=1 Tax=Enterobacter hormaechei TaxID=158836 RepID=UPI00203CF396